MFTPAIVCTLTMEVLSCMAGQPPAPPPPQARGSFRVESFGPAANKLEKNLITSTKDEPPRIVYAGSRTSRKFLSTGQGNQAVDDGISWQGKTAYLSLTFELILVDDKTSQTAWTIWTGAFWDTITFANTAEAGKPAVWVVELQSSRHPEYRQQYDLATGKQLALIGKPAAPSGTPIKPRLEYRGSAGLVEGKEYRLVTSLEEWNTLRARLFPADTRSLPSEKDINFSKEVALVCYAGKSVNWNGISSELVVENDQRVLIRLHRHTYQSFGKTPDTYPYGIIVLPRVAGKDYVLEYNRQNLIGGPPMWKEFLTLKLPKQGE